MVTTLTIREKLRGKIYQFRSKQGIFSKERIDPGTRLLIEKMEIDKKDVILDLGCGYGAAGIVAADLAKNGKVYLVDSDIRAVRLAEENIKLNGIKNAKVLISDCLNAILGIKFDKILTYPPTHVGSEVIEEFIKASKDGLKLGGMLFVVTQNKLAPYFKKKIKEIFGEVEILAHSQTHVVFRAIK